jgi:hypothetical protein
VSYAQAPVGWWQDSKGTMQPPGSFLSPSLRVPSEGPSGADTTAVTSSSRGRFKKWTNARLRRHS